MHKLFPFLSCLTAILLSEESDDGERKSVILVNYFLQLAVEEGEARELCLNGSACVEKELFAAIEMHWVSQF